MGLRARGLLGRGIIMGITAKIYRTESLAGCSNGGISESYNTVTIVNLDGPVEPSPERPAVRLVSRKIGGSTYVHVEPFEPVDEGLIGYMSGGAFVYSHNPKFKKATGHGAPVPLHDRVETPAEYAALSS